MTCATAPFPWMTVGMPGYRGGGAAMPCSSGLASAAGVSALAFGVVVLLFMSRSAVVGHESQGGPDLAGGRVVPSGRPGCVASLLTLQVCSPERGKHRRSECEAGLGAGVAGIRW